MSEKTTIIVTPSGPDRHGYRVEVNGEQIGCFANDGYAAAHYARQWLEVQRLEKIIREHADWLRSSEPAQAHLCRKHADDLLKAAGIVT